MKRQTRFTRACLGAVVVCLVAVGCSGGSEGADPERADPASTSPAPAQSTASREPEVETVDIVAVAPGKIVPNGRVKVIQSIGLGTIKAIHVTDGQRVRAGDVLIELDPTLTQADLKRADEEFVFVDYRSPR